jgi:hypothetical protein
LWHNYIEFGTIRAKVRNGHRKAEETGLPRGYKEKHEECKNWKMKMKKGERP